jgi:hypothetical protein
MNKSSMLGPVDSPQDGQISYAAGSVWLQIRCICSQTQSGRVT